MKSGEGFCTLADSHWWLLLNLATFLTGYMQQKIKHWSIIHIDRIDLSNSIVAWLHIRIIKKFKFLNVNLDEVVYSLLLGHGFTALKKYFDFHILPTTNRRLQTPS
jgi:hypothetical protein